MILYPLTFEPTDQVSLDIDIHISFSACNSGHLLLAIDCSLAHGDPLLVDFYQTLILHVLPFILSDKSTDIFNL